MNQEPEWTVAYISFPELDTNWLTGGTDHLGTVTPSKPLTVKGCATVLGFWRKGRLGDTEFRFLGHRTRNGFSITASPYPEGWAVVFGGYYEVATPPAEAIVSQ